MKKVKLTLLISLVFMLIAFYSNSEIHADPLISTDNIVLPSVKEHPVPFKASIKAMIIGQTGTPPTLYITVEGTGNASHLGKIGFHLDEVIDLISYTSEQIVTFTAANGDKFYGVAHSTLSPTSDPDVLEVNGSGDITGGTGRFVNASGTLIVKAIVNTVIGTVDCSVKGTLMY